MILFVGSRISSTMITGLASVLFTTGVTTHAGPTSAIPPDEVLSRLGAVTENIRDYTVTLDVTVDLDRLKVPAMKITMYFRQPDKVRFDSQDRFAMLPREGMTLNPRRLRENFHVGSGVPDTLGGKSVYRVVLKPKKDKTGLQELYLYIDSTRWTPERLVSPLFDGRTMSLSYAYAKVNGFWLPSENVVTFSSTVTDTTEQDAPAQSNLPVRAPRMPRNGTVTIRYSDYKVNTGLGDEVFEKKENDGM